MNDVALRANDMMLRTNDVGLRPMVLRFAQTEGYFFHPNTKVLDCGGLFVFFGVKNNTLSPLHLFLDLLDLNLQLFESILNF